MFNYQTVNAIISYRAADTTPVEDPVTGEISFNDTTLTVIEASLEEGGSTLDAINVTPGVDVNSIYLTGRAINPKTLPASFTPGSIVNITYKNMESDRPARFYILPTVKSRFGLESYFGDAIAGLLLD